VKGLFVDQAIYFVSAGETLDAAFLMLFDRRSMSFVTPV
jgi:hypothetical protein